MNKFICSVCGYVYDEASGDPENGVEPGTKWEEVPEKWVCPLCGAAKSDFEKQKESGQEIEQHVDLNEDNVGEMRELSFGELSALCSNLSKGFEKQYRTEEADLFLQLSEYYEKKIKSDEGKNFKDLNSLTREDLKLNYPRANKIAEKEGDRGALRALAWGEKVTKIMNSIIDRYKEQKDSLLKNKNIYVCEICGFVYIGKKSPDICPVCKVPNIKITRI